MAAFVGTLIHTPLSAPSAVAAEPHPVEILRDHFLITNSAGDIVHLGPCSGLDAALQQYNVPQQCCRYLTPTQFLLPGFVDTHFHAPQYSFVGTGTDLPLFDWLNTYTFPAEARLKDVGLARKLYTDVVNRLLRLGTTTAAYFTTADPEPCQVLADVVLARGQRALVGKVSMDQNAPPGTAQTTQQDVAGAAQVIAYVKALGSQRVLPCVIPRFTPTCSSELLQALGALAQQEGCRVQSHISESAEQVEWSQRLHPAAPHDAAVFDAAGLLKHGAVFAHGTHLDAGGLQLLRDRGGSISHCALSNMYFGDGLLNVRRVLELGVGVGLGTDVAGGYTPSMLQAIRMAVVNSHALKAAQLQPGASSAAAAAANEDHVLTWQQALWMATMGGAVALGLEQEVGSFAEGKQLDALLVDVGMQEVFDHYGDPDDKLQQLELFVHLGDDRNILQVYVGGTSRK